MNPDRRFALKAGQPHQILNLFMHSIRGVMLTKPPNTKDKEHAHDSHPYYVDAHNNIACRPFN